jgi:hypothetical protein
MEISNAKYYEENGENVCITCILNGKHTAIPIDSNNADYQAIQEWVAEGNKIEDAD